MNLRRIQQSRTWKRPVKSSVTSDIPSGLLDCANGGIRRRQIWTGRCQPLKTLSCFLFYSEGPGRLRSWHGSLAHRWRCGRRTLTFKVAHHRAQTLRDAPPTLCNANDFIQGLIWTRHASDIIRHGALLLFFPARVRQSMSLSQALLRGGSRCRCPNGLVVSMPSEVAVARGRND